jgi:hypothetical protein
MDAAAEIRELLKTPDVPELGPRSRTNAKPAAALTAQVRSVLSEGQLSETAMDLVCGTVLLWHDHLDAAHKIAQDIENADGSYLHAIMHRREPDYGNAKYWFRLVGNHPCFPLLAQKVTGMQGATPLTARFAKNGEWDPFAFVDACEQHADKAANHPGVQVLRNIQAMEFELFLDHLLKP